MAIKWSDAIKDAKIQPLLKAFMASEHNSENYDFLMSKDGNDKLYGKFVSSKSSTQVNLPSAVQKQLDDLAAKKKWSDMKSGMDAARADVMRMVNADVMPRFENSKGYKDLLAANAPKPPDLTAAKAAVGLMEKDIVAGTTFITTAIATVKTKGKPANKEEVNRMFESARMRHDKVNTPYTALLQKDKAFTRENFGAFFTKKDAFTKLCMEYRKVLT